MGKHYFWTRLDVFVVSRNGAHFNFCIEQYYMCVNESFRTNGHTIDNVLLEFCGAMFLYHQSSMTQIRIRQALIKTYRMQSHVTLNGTMLNMSRDRF